ncbi:FAD-dependent oxidoreductase [Pseudoponticoccus marisrubri]|uniref:GMC family oxidoreductase n=1 Tax=Pseudoponticoccus marisrubri TaxID=1685382 RepID=A0A0W7WJC2_9RHOB|nr:GMC family oxidoreductase [Pseudoponticoccus marisrubri]KUF10716.1 GMC family oxidoreductase [Pseudoponticoccus marisrubri]
MSDAADIVIVGSGMGGATLAATLAPTGRRIVILERGDHLRPSAHDRDDEAIFVRGHYRPSEEWLDGSGTPFNPGNYYNVGGNSKFYGAVLLRYRAEDFRPLRHMGGTTTGWPISYDALEPFYGKAEQLYAVRGRSGEDPTDPARSSDYAFGPVPDEPAISDLRARLSSVGLHPASLPLGVDLDRWLSRAKTPWDAFPDTTGGKLDAESGGLRAALAHRNVSLRTNSRVSRLRVARDGRLTGVELDTGEVITAKTVVLSAGAVQSAALLLASADAAHPNGLANSSDQVGRNFMNHNCSAVLALHPLRRNPSVYQKTLMVNDFYLTGGPNGEPLGNIQLLGKISGPILRAASPLPGPVATWIARRSVDLYAMSEDLPNPESRVTLNNGRIVLDWKRSNWEAHLALVARLKRALRKAGYPIVISRPFDRRTPSHQCGTTRMGTDPATSVTDSFGRSHDHRNLFILDASILPTSAAVNPALTIAALAIRAGEHIAQHDLAA